MVGSVCDCESAGLSRAGGEEVMWLSWSVGAAEVVSDCCHVNDD